ncbi:tetratricopeptide repeat protein [Aliiglaciecola sp. M165]|uniref:tetratricopeptide repeat protein n=1 Tax=Aliiglaciecola sp. M165 TaxID=2593649 RepID=UPI00117DB733|nr:tetratricopeptide repeat protein [Aliiglaciecola sp. M165]TRY33912.1 tetratricopeptide repeat protein [Aliiglaciecola sp. M165]
MSVVNKMLQDLEARKTEPNSTADYQPPAASKSARPWIYGLLAIIVLVFAAWMILDPQQQEQRQNSQTVQVQPLDTGELSDQVNSAESQVDSSVTVHSNLSTDELEEPQTQQPSQTAPLSAEQLQAYSFNQNTPAAQQANAQALKELDELVNEESELSQMKQAKMQPSMNETEADSFDDGLADSQSSSSAVMVKSRSSATSTDTQPETQSIDDQQGEFRVRSSQSVETLDGLKQQVQIALKRGDENEAIELLTKLLQKAPDNIAARKRLAAMLFGQGKHLQADDVLQKGVLAHPDDHDLRLMQARLWVQMKNPSKAHELLNAYQVSAKLAPDYVSYRASLAQQVSRFDAAKADYLKLTHSQPANARWWLGLAVAEERLGNLQPALQAYQTAKGLDQLSVEVDKFVEQRIQYLAGIN